MAMNKKDPRKTHETEQAEAIRRQMYAGARGMLVSPQGFSMGQYARDLLTHYVGPELAAMFSLMITPKPPEQEQTFRARKGVKY